MNITDFAQEYIYYIIGGLIMLLLVVMLCKNRLFTNKSKLIPYYKLYSKGS